LNRINDFLKNHHLSSFIVAIDLYRTKNDTQ
jgi:hypothetical protein